MQCWQQSSPVRYSFSADQNKSPWDHLTFCGQVHESWECNHNNQTYDKCTPPRNRSAKYISRAKSITINHL